MRQCARCLPCRPLAKRHTCNLLPSWQMNFDHCRNTAPSSALKRGDRWLIRVPDPRVQRPETTIGHIARTKPEQAGCHTLFPRFRQRNNLHELGFMSCERPEVSHPITISVPEKANPDDFSILPTRCICGGAVAAVERLLADRCFGRCIDFGALNRAERQLLLIFLNRLERCAARWIEAVDPVNRIITKQPVRHTFETPFHGPLKRQHAATA